MRLAVIADVHVGNHAHGGGRAVNGLNERCLTTLRVLRKASAMAAKLDAVLVIAGDLYDSARPTPQMIAVTIAALSPAAGLGVRLLAGNHDRVTDAAGDNALAPMAEVPWVKVIDTPVLRDGVLYMPPQPRGVPAVDWLSDALSVFKPGSVDVVIGHVGLVGPNTPKFLRDGGGLDQETAAGMLKRHGAKAILAGDWHSRRATIVDGVLVEQIGALVPTGWDNPGMDYGYLRLLDTDDPFNKRVFQLDGPRFLQANDAAEAAELAAAGKYVRLVAPRGTPVPDGVQLIEPAVLEKRKAETAKATAVSSVDDAVRAAVEELVTESLRSAVLIKSMEALAAAESKQG